MTPNFIPLGLSYSQFPQILDIIANLESYIQSESSEYNQTKETDMT